MKNRVVITGLGAVTPVGNDVASMWDGMLAGRSGGGAISHFDAHEGYATRIACEVKDFDPTSFLDSKEARRFDRFSHFALCSSDEAMHMAGYPTGDHGLTPERFGVIFGSGIGGISTFEGAVSRAHGAGSQAGESVFHSDVHSGHRGRPGQYPSQRPWGELRDRLGVCVECARDRRRRAHHRSGVTPMS